MYSSVSTDHTFPNQGGVTIRSAGPADAPAISRLAALDSSVPPAGDLLLAEVDGELWAATPVDGGPAIADPFRPSGELVGLLALRVTQLETAAHGDTRPTAWPRRFLQRAQA